MRDRLYLNAPAVVAILLLVALWAPAVLVASAAESPVADAAMRGDIDTVRALLREGADVNAAQGDGMTALHWSALGDDVATMEVLLSTESGGLMLFVQYPGPTTGGRPIYDGRFNMAERKAVAGERTDR